MSNSNIISCGAIGGALDTTVSKSDVHLYDVRVLLRSVEGIYVYRVECVTLGVFAEAYDPDEALVALAFEIYGLEK